MGTTAGPRSRATAPTFILACAFAALATLLALGAARAEPAAAEGTGERRLALVLGTGAYDSVSSLANPVRDATAIASKLEGLGFDVHRGLDLDLAELRRTVASFTAAAQDADTVLVYFSGHAFQLRGLNYLVPSDAKLETKASIATETMRLDTLLGDLQGGGRQVLAFLDACRNNPLPPSRRSGDGLAQVETGKGVFVAFATSPGRVSYDGRGEHSPFTQGLLDHIGAAGQSVSDMMISVRNSVEAHTLHQQTPWDQSSLQRQVYLAEPADERPVLTAAVAPTRTDAILSTPRTLDLSPEAAPDAAPKPDADAAGSEIASLGPVSGLSPWAPDAGTTGADEPSGGEVIVVPDVLPGVLEGEDLVFAVQEELKRVGCYRSTVDGIWGKGSRTAAARYLESKKVSASAAEPTDFLLGALKGETGEVCVPPPPPPPPRRTAPARTNKPTATVRRSRPSAARPNRSR